MDSDIKRKIRWSALKISLLYALAAVVWIFTSDGLSRLFTDDPSVLLWTEVGKGWVYVFVTAVLLYALLCRYLREQAQQQSQAAAALHASEGSYQEIFHAVTDGIFIHDVGDGHLVDVNQAMLEMYGIESREKALSLKAEDLSSGVPPYTAADVARWLRKAAEEGVQVFEWHAKRANGKLFWVDVTLRSVRIGGHDRILAIIRDITEQKHVREDLQQLAAAVEQTVEAVSIADPHGKILYANHAFEAITGYTRKEVIGKSFRLLKSGKHDPDFYKDLWDTISKGEVWRGFFINRKKDGTLYQEESTITPMKDANGRITSYVSVKRDVSREIALELQVLQSQKMEAVGRLAGGVAHDFNNMITSIVGYGELCKRHLPPGDQLHHNIDEILKAAERAASLTRHLLAFSRKQVLETKTFDLNELVQKIRTMLRHLISEEIDLITNLQHTALRPVKADPVQIEQVIVNMAINARDAMPNGGQLILRTANVIIEDSPSVGIMHIPPGEYVLLSIGDTGIGMSEEIKAHLFEPFFTTKGKEKGTGLGLATSYGIIRQSGGYISVTSKEDAGSTFDIYLPCAAGQVVATKAEAPPSQEAAYSRDGEVVLLVEDEEVVRASTQMVLTELGYTVLTAGNGVEALQLIHQRNVGRIDLLLTDIMMPQMGGRELAQKVKQLKPSLKVLFVSGYAEDAIKHHGLVLPDTAYLPKPYKMAVLASKIREVLDS